MPHETKTSSGKSTGESKATHESYEDTPELARRTKTSESYWNKLRVAGEGPPYTKIGRLVRYRPSDVDTWLASLTRSSTSEASEQGRAA